MMFDSLIRRWHLLPEGEGHFSEISITFGIKDLAFRQEQLKANWKGRVSFLFEVNHCTRN